MPQQPEEKHVTKVIVLLDTLIRLNLPNGPSPLISVENTNEAVHPVGAHGQLNTRFTPTAKDAIHHRNPQPQRTRKYTEKFMRALCSPRPLWFVFFGRSLRHLGLPQVMYLGYLVLLVFSCNLCENAQQFSPPLGAATPPRAWKK
jgi:hypothetical protein